ncbi:MAG: hypothetical protein B7Z66_08825 [Chromatiales bacterium 21-64-14]|nr:MAG: hypothetical protein B7Z66_08825 [Chromatiales bacterium 21-64-14]HQU16115.1 DUF3530 family protein [Gammaproteobacteria bacterium]
MYLRPLVFLTLFLAAGRVFPATGADTAREQHWAQELQATLLTGHAESLKTASGTSFFAIYTVPTGGLRVYGGVILLHRMGANPDWADVVRPLRIGLAGEGWATLSLQMPVLSADAAPKDYGALFPDVPPRIEAGIQFLKSKGIKPIMLVGDHMGAAMGAYFLAHNANSGIRAFVGIGMPSDPDPKSPLDTATALKQIHIPVLDLYGSGDFDDVLEGVPQRAAAARAAGNHAFAQVQIYGAGPDFRDLDSALLIRVQGWLRKYSPGTTGRSAPGA